MASQYATKENTYFVTSMKKDNKYDELTVYEGSNKYFTNNEAKELYKNIDKKENSAYLYKKNMKTGENKVIYSKE